MSTAAMPGCYSRAFVRKTPSASRAVSHLRNRMNSPRRCYDFFQMKLISTFSATLATSLLLATSSVVAAPAQEKALSKAANDVEWKSFVFFSWYDGWGQHRVWGIGQVQASSSGGAAYCGGKKISIVPSYDTHAALKAPMPFQSKEFAAAYNREVLRLLRLQGIYCTFEQTEQE